jgi:hypothetical protein
MKRFISIPLALAVVALATNAVLAQSKAAPGFEKLKSLVGEWQGTSPEGPVTVTYQLVSGGHSVMETIAPGTDKNMVTVYHLNGDKLMMTHYCAVGNQPRMSATVPAGEVKNLNFTFVDATNMAKPADAHMHSLAVTFQDKDHITQVWTYRQDGKDMPMTFNLERKK